MCMSNHDVFCMFIHLHLDITWKPGAMCPTVLVKRIVLTQTFPFSNFQFLSNLCSPMSGLDNSAKTHNQPIFRHSLDAVLQYFLWKSAINPEILAENSELNEIYLFTPENVKQMLICLFTTTQFGKNGSVTVFGKLHYQVSCLKIVLTRQKDKIFLKPFLYNARLEWKMEGWRQNGETTIVLYPSSCSNITCCSKVQVYHLVVVLVH